MSTFKRLSVLCCVVLLFGVVIQAAPRSRRVKYNFNSGWKLFVGDPAGAEAQGFDDSAWKDVDGRRWEQRLEVMRDAVVYNRNNPSVLFYESGNKGVSEEHMRQMRAIRDAYDPHGGRASGSREMLDSRVAEYGGEMLYINKSARLPFWAMEYSRDEALRKYWDEFSPPFHKDGEGPLHQGQDASAYNRNQDSHAVENVVRWYDYWRERPGTGARVSSGGVNIVFSDSNTHHRGAENYRRSGEVDAVRLPKDGYFAHQVMWDGWVDVEHRRPLELSTGDEEERLRHFERRARRAVPQRRVFRSRRAVESLPLHLQERRVAAGLARGGWLRRGREEGRRSEQKDGRGARGLETDAAHVAEGFARRRRGRGARGRGGLGRRREPLPDGAERD